MLTRGREVWSQALVSDLLKEENENISGCSHFPQERTDTTLLNPDEKKGNSFHA